MSKKLKSVTAYLILGFVIGVFIYLINNYAIEIRDGEHQDLSHSSQVYISEITGESLPLGFNDSVYSDNLGKATELGGNDNKNEFSLDFTFGDKSGNKLERSVYIVTNIPRFLLMDVFKITSLEWLVDLINWSLGIFLFMAMVIWIRRGNN